MFVDNNVVKGFGEEQRYDKFAIASTMFDVSFQGASCSVIESQVLKSCDACNLRFMCGKIDEVIREYTEKTTVVAASFNFGE